MVFIYSYPVANRQSTWQYRAQAYVYPFFRQGWNLFVPPPDRNYSLFAEYEHNGIQRKDILQDLVLAHQTNRLRGLEPVLVGLTNCIHQFEREAQQKGFPSGAVGNDLNYTIMEHAARMYLQSLTQLRPVKARFFLLVEETGTGTRRVYYRKQ